MGFAADRPTLLAAGEGETIFDSPNRTIRILVDRDELVLTWFRYEPGEEGPDPHVHRRHTDAFYVLEGELELGLGPEVSRATAGAGTFAAAPPNVVHTFRNASDATAVFLNIHAPSMGFAEMLRADRDGRDDAAEHFDQFDPPADGGRPLSDAVFRRPDEGKLVRAERSSNLVKAEELEVGGFFSLGETTLRPGFCGSLPHQPGQLAHFYVLEGALLLELDGQRIEAGPGSLAIVPPPNILTVGNPLGAPARLLNLVAPDGADS